MYVSVQVRRLHLAFCDNRHQLILLQQWQGLGAVFCPRKKDSISWRYAAGEENSLFQEEYCQGFYQQVLFYL